MSSALSALLLGGQGGSERCRQALRGLGGEAAFEDVVQLGVSVDRIATLNAAVCLPFYSSMVAQAEAARHATGTGGGVGFGSSTVAGSSSSSQVGAGT